MSNTIALRPEQQTGITLSDMQTMAQAVARSGLFGVKTPDQALALMLVAHAEGMHPAIAARDYHIIEGRPAMKADAMLARFQSAGGKVRWTVMTEDKVSAVFSHPAGGEVEITWTLEMAQKARLSTKTQRDGGPNMWQKFPRQMLRARVVSEGIRTVFPGVLAGTYTPEEITDMDDHPKPMQDVTPKPSAQEKLDKLTAPEEAPKTPKAPMTLFDFDACDGSGELLQLTGPDWLAQAEIALNTHEHPATFWKANEAEFYRIQQAATEKGARKVMTTCSRVADLAHQAMQTEG
jgi:hypothetical protein